MLAPCSILNYLKATSAQTGISAAKDHNSQRLSRRKTSKAKQQVLRLMSQRTEEVNEEAKMPDDRHDSLSPVL
ncbi:hypothetical protein ZWY2020_009368 [Hordeum vulgare]|nr:hypothetical protein ZWY2020_009368 [Hordeum vulgare]